MEYELYKWQKECLNKWEENNYKGIVNVVTGAGKTTLAINAIKKVFSKDLRVKIVVPTVNLLFQWKKEILKNFKDIPDFEVALFYGGSKPKKSAIFSIYVVNSARHSISKAIVDDTNNGFKVMMIADELHRYLSKENSKIFHYLLAKNFKKEQFFSLGLTATIDECDINEMLTLALGKVIYKLDYNEASKDDIISSFVIYETSINFMPFEAEEYNNISATIEKMHTKIIRRYPHLRKIDDLKMFMKAIRLLEKQDEDIQIYIKLLLKRKKISSMSKTRIACGVEIVKQLYDKKIIVFSERIAQIKEFEQRLLAEGISNVSCYHSKQTQEYRKRILQDYKDGVTNILLTCRALDEGVDIPDAEVAIVLSSSSIARQRIQRLGRILRKNNDKLVASLFYLYLCDANDDVLYLEDLHNEKNKILKLRYYDGDKTFINYQYEKQMINLYKIQKETINPDLSKEYMRCLKKGMLRNDWLLAKQDIEKKIKESKTIAEKNYYVVMKKLLLIRSI